MSNTPERVTFGPDIHNALAGGDGEAVLAAVAQSGGDPTMETVGLRLLLSDFWTARKGDVNGLARVVEGGTPLDAAVKAVIGRTDSELAQLQTPHLAADEEVRARAVARRQRLLDELTRKSPPERVAFLKSFEDLTTEQLGTPDTLMTWTSGWRDVVVDRLSPVVRDTREEGVHSSSVSSFLAVEADILGGYFDKLIKQATFRHTD